MLLELKKYKTKLITFSLLYSMCLICNSWATPWTSVGDIALRNDIEILAHAGFINGPMNTWPMSWKQITSNLYKADNQVLSPYIKRALERVKAKIPGKFAGQAKVSYTNMPTVIKGFSHQNREEFETGGYVEFNSDGGTTVHIEGGYRSGDGEGYHHLDGSYIAQDIQNWSIYSGLIDRWWGPGRETTMILSNSARPMPSIGIRRVEPKAFKNKFLSWIGPWQWDMFVAKMEEERHIPNALLVGMRLSFEPIDNFDIGLSRTLQLCGDGRPCGFTSWTKALISIGDLDNPTDRTDLSQEPGNQLASIDLSYDLKIGERANLKLYAEGTAEDLLVILPYEYAKMIGFSFYGPYGDQGSSWRLTAEFSDTIATLVWFGGRRRENVLYNHHIYRTGYRYKNRPLGHILDADSQMLSLGGQYTASNNWIYSVKYHHALINRNGDEVVSTSVSQTEERINVLEAGLIGNFGFGDINLKMRLYDDRPNTPGVSNNGADINISWSLSY